MVNSVKLTNPRKSYLDDNRVDTIRQIRRANAVDNQREGAVTVTLAAVAAFGAALWLTLAFHESVPQVFIAAFFWAVWGGLSTLAWAGWMDYRDMKRRFDKEFSSL